MNRWTLAPVLLLASVMALAARAAADDAAPTTSASQIDIASLITSLGDPDPAVRGEASLRLSSFANSARPALEEALNSGAAEVRIQAGQLLLRLPWAQP